MLKRWVVIACAILWLSGLAAADEGMWLFNAAPKDQIAKKYHFNLTQPWLDHVRLSSVRFNNGGSGSFVSADGLTFTNHHIAQDCLHGLSSESKDLYKTGFYAPTRAEEAKCPDLELNVLEGMEDVTDKVNAKVKPDMPAAEAGTAQRAAMAQIEQECAARTGLRCDVVTLYSGARYQLYQYKKYTDVRLVFAPEFDAAFFGGDPDNFEYPRWDLDISFFRVYENDKPVHLEHYFTWSPDGAKDNELVFVSGNPGSTGRLDTMAQLEFLRDTNYPWRLKSGARHIALLEKYSDSSPEHARQAQEELFGWENSQKAIKGYEDGLLDKKLMAKKAAEEQTMRAAVATDPKQKQEYGDPWADVAKAEEVQKQIWLPLVYLERRAGFRGDLAGIARVLVRAATEKAKPNSERLREYRDSALPSLEQSLFSTAPIYKSMNEVVLADSMKEMQEEMPADEALAMVLNGRTPAQAAHELIAGTRLEDVAVRKQLYQGGQAAIDASTDPLILALKTIDPEARAVRKQYDDKVESVERNSGASIAKLRFASQGFDQPPDATFTLRLSYGVMKGYTEDGRGTVPAGTKLPYFTTMGGAFQHQAQHGDKDPYKLPPSWMAAKAKLKLGTPLNNISTPDIIGGNSGSPVVNEKAQIVGIIFDGNIQSLPWNFVYEDVIGRSLSVDSRGILEALRVIYGAPGLADELTGKATAPASGKEKAPKP